MHELPRNSMGKIQKSELVSSRLRRTYAGVSSRHDRRRHQRRRSPAVEARSRHATQTARRGRARVRRPWLPRSVGRQAGRGRRRRRRHVLPLLRLEEGDLRRARARPEPPRPTRDEGRLVEGQRRGSSRKLLGFEAYFRFTAEHPGPLPDHPAGRVRLARDAALPLRPSLSRLHRGAPRSRRVGRDRRARPRSRRLRADGHGRDDRDALDPLGRPQARARQRVSTSSSASSAASSGPTPNEDGGPRRDRFVPAGAVDDRCRDRGGLRHPGAGDRREVRPARQAHRGAGRARQRPLGRRRASACSTRPSTDPASIDVVLYYGSMWRDYPVWQVAPHIADRLGATNAFAIEYDNVSHGTPIALRVARDLLRAEEELQTILVVAACRESYLLDYDERALALHVQLRRRRGRRARRRRRGSQRDPRLARGHRRLVLAAGEGAGRRVGRPATATGSSTSPIRSR